MKISIPNIATPEVKYTFDCLLKEFLGLQFEIEITPENQNFILAHGGKSIVIENHFFIENNPKSWYQPQNIPTRTTRFSVDINDKKYPIQSIFGKPELEQSGDNFILKSDIIAATFFMLSRWEEVAETKRDQHGRFSSKDSIAFRDNFLHHAIVNEYVEILWFLLKKIGVPQTRKNRNFKFVPTHDVDIPFLFPNMFSGFRAIGRHLIERNSFNDGIEYLKKYFKGKDAYDTHDIFLDGAEKMGEKAHFFFMAGGKHKFDPRPQIHHPKVKSLIEKIKERGHHIGFHPSYETYQDSELFLKEKTILEQVVEQKITTGRQHYLRFEVPSTWKIWEKYQMKWDSSMSYSDAIGFRCGVCYSFPTFDILARKKLNLYEKPLQLMEVTLGLYLQNTLQDAREKVHHLVQEVKKYDGEFVFLWHNSSLNFRQFARYNSILFDLYKNAI